jgi:hypothetical protein
MDMGLERTFCAFRGRGLYWSKPLSQTDYPTGLKFACGTSHENENTGIYYFVV